MGLLIDEIDRADDEFEAFLLEFLSAFQVSIPELGTITAERRPLVVVTSNRTRELHDALKRRCLYHWIDYPTAEREAEIVRARLPGVPDEIADRVCGAVARLRARSSKAPRRGRDDRGAQARWRSGCRPQQTLGVVLRCARTASGRARRGAARAERDSQAATRPPPRLWPLRAGDLAEPHRPARLLAARCAARRPGGQRRAARGPIAHLLPSIPPIAAPLLRAAGQCAPS